MAATITPAQALALTLEQIDVQFDRVLKDALDESLKELPLPHQEAIQNVLSIPAVRQPLLDLARDQVQSTDPSGIFRSMLRELCNQNLLAASFKSGQIRGLASRIEQGKAPESFRPSHWYVHESPATDLILADGCVFTTSQEGLVGSLFRFGPSWNAFYLPISPSKFLVGTRSPSCSILSALEVNQVSAELSLSHIYARLAGNAERILAQRIGTGDPLLSQDELVNIVSAPLSP